MKIISYTFSKKLFIFASVWKKRITWLAQQQLLYLTQWTHWTQWHTFIIWGGGQCYMDIATSAYMTSVDMDIPPIAIFSVQTTDNPPQLSKIGIPHHICWGGLWICTYLLTRCTNCWTYSTLWTCFHWYRLSIGVVLPLLVFH